MNPTKPIVAAAALALVCACQQETSGPSAPDLPPGVALVETVAPKPGDKVAIPYAKYLLDNGLTVILHEDGSDPLAHVDVTYHVGSAREEVGKGGVVRDEAVHAAVCRRIARWLEDDAGWRLLGTTESPIAGAAGNREFLLAARKPG